jgi:hypothetical protein
VVQEVAIDRPASRQRSWCARPAAIRGRAALRPRRRVDGAASDDLLRPSAHPLRAGAVPRTVRPGVLRRRCAVATFRRRSRGDVSSRLTSAISCSTRIQASRREVSAGCHVLPLSQWSVAEGAAGWRSWSLRRAQLTLAPPRNRSPVPGSVRCSAAKSGGCHGHRRPLAKAGVRA